MKPGPASVAGFLASTDQGQTWERRGWRDYNRTFYCEQGSDGTIWCACGNGVLRSTDGGYSWRTTTGWEVTEVLKVKAAETGAIACIRFDRIRHLPEHR